MYHDYCNGHDYHHLSRSHHHHGHATIIMVIIMVIAMVIAMVIIMVAIMVITCSVCGEKHLTRPSPHPMKISSSPTDRQLALAEKH